MVLGVPILKHFRVVAYAHLLAESVRQVWLLLRLSAIPCFLAKTVVHDKWLHSETVCAVLLLAESLDRKHN